MLGLALTTYDRITPGAEHDAQRRAFERSYLGMRLVVGALGVALPWGLIVLDRWLDGSISTRGSMSAYYHSGARDLFVGVLVAIGVFLLTYLWWRWRTWDFVLSSVAGLGVIGVALLPTARDRGSSDVPPGAAGCLQDLRVACSPLQEVLHEDLTRGLHWGATVVVVLGFAALALVFALRSFGYGPGARVVHGDDPARLGVRATYVELRRRGGLGEVLRHLVRDDRRVLLYLACVAGVLGGGAWAVVGLDTGWSHTLVGEVVAFTSFGVAWLTAGSDLLRRSRSATA